MTAKKPEVSKSKANEGALTHNPFAKLADQKNLVNGLASPTTPKPVDCAQPVKPPPPCKLRLRLETKGRSGKVVTRITGLPEANLETIAVRLRKALGCGAVVEGVDVLLVGSLADRAAEWLERAGDLRAVLAETPASNRRAPATTATETLATTRTSSSGMNRSEVRRGQRVAIVLKVDQGTGKLTEGFVRDLLTNSSVHPRGIKVRLETGEVGRVKVIYGIRTREPPV